ncbi:MoaD/ThiS family protein [Crossiella sp. CA-258035]|uniref:ubiquitin-like small modifier protein 1 n=1 Tax=Crossiella sp. CA-258035 TaxID=2981138 RepID=UPI0024BD5817|nr:ubiquitin-like small modifier protein 1 [Crossiella sp. CA-258035]WHT21224.1 MoaD/ThiS family protein [Crossiella sp. CA-258035]
MRVTVLVPGVLRPSAGGAATLELDLPEQTTLGGALDVLAADHPALNRRLRTEQGTLRRYVNFYVNGEECRRLNGPDTPLPPGAEIQVIPSVAGG